MPAENILVVIVDGLRASALGAYGNTTFPTPALDRFAADSFLLDWCFAPSADLDEIYRALWQSVHPARAATSASPLSLPLQLATKGYATTLITDEPKLPLFGPANDFNQCLQLHNLSKLDERPVRGADSTQTSLASLFASASEAVAAVTPESPCLVWVHARGMYGPWDAPFDLQHSLLDEGDPPPIREITPPDFTVANSDDPDAAFRYACAYAAQAMVLDACWESLIDAVDSPSTDNRWLVMLLGARGFPLGEHRRVGGVDARLYAEQLHVPWLIRFPNRFGRLARSGQLISHFDLAPTLLSSDTTDGMNLRSLAVAPRPGWRDFLIATNAARHRAIRTADWSLRQDTATRGDEASFESALSPGAELYVRPDDRWEANDVAKLCPDVLETLERTMDDTLQRMTQEP